MGGKKISSLDLWDPGGSSESPFSCMFLSEHLRAGGLLPVFTSVVGWGSFLLPRTFGKNSILFSRTRNPVLGLDLSCLDFENNSSFGYSFH